MRGGEIYVPKIPSIRITDLARFMAPKLPHRQVGIRPGEKLHEIMVTEDDGRMTVDQGNRYVILPSFPFWGEEARPADIRGLVPEGFRYSSDSNTEWMDEAAVKAVLAAT
jgi:UDP-N-acetylglucosamine 4,6-dehydratase